MRLFSVFAAVLMLPSAALAADPPRDLVEALRGRLVRADAGRLTPAAPPTGTRLIAFYFGASWCGPCRAFQPELGRAYRDLRSVGKEVEIVFVSDDADCRRMADYILSMRMAWPALGCRDRARLAWLQRARGAALPGLLVYNAKGRLLVTSWSPTGRSRPGAALKRLMTLAVDSHPSAR